MKKFCGKCGSKLDEETGLCSKCNAGKPAGLSAGSRIPGDGEGNSAETGYKKQLSKKDRKKITRDRRKAKRSGWTRGKRIRHMILKLIIIILVLFALFVCAVWLLDHFGILPVQSGSDDSNPDAVYTTEEAREFAGQSESVNYDEETGTLYLNSRLLVVAEEGTEEDSIEDLAEDYQAELDLSMEELGIYALTLDEEMSYSELNELGDEITQQYDFVDDVYLDYIIETFADDETDAASYVSPVYPSDPWDGDTWDTSAPEGSNWGVEAINAPEAWSYLDQMQTVRIGLIDSMPQQSEEVTVEKSTNIIIDDITGMQYISDELVDEGDHGTHVAGTMNASWDNDEGISGVMGGKGELYYCSVNYQLDGSIISKYYSSYAYMLALKTLIDDDVQVINISQNTWALRGFAASHGNENAINYLTEQAGLTEKFLSRIISSRRAQQKNDFIICTSAGNSNDTYYYKDDDEPYGYREEKTLAETFLSWFREKGESGGSEAKYNNFLNLIEDPDVMDHIIVVGAVQIDSEATDSQDTDYAYCSFSNIGDRVDVVAPGADIYSTVVDGYDYKTGTSMAAPHVSGVAGLIFAIAPGMSAGTVKEIICDTARGEYSDWSYPLINALYSVERAVDISGSVEMEGYVYDADGEPLSGVTVVAEVTESSASVETESDDDGYYCFEISYGDNYTITYELEGYDSVQNELELSGETYHNAQDGIRMTLDNVYMEETETDVSDTYEIMEYGGNYYSMYYVSNITWTEAEAFCEAMGGHLVTINSEEEQQAVYQYIEEYADDTFIWIGISDAGSEGDWSSWITGEEVTYTNWAVSQPDNEKTSSDTEQNYGVIFSGYRSGTGYYIEPGQWDDVENDYSEDRAGFFVCEWEDSLPENFL